MKLWTRGLILVSLFLGGWLVVSQSNGAAPPATDSPLAVRQQAVRRMIADMEERFVRLAQSLESTEPEHAARLVETLQRSKQDMIEPRMARVAELLNTGNLEAAKAEQQKLIDELQHLIDMLTGVDKLTELMRQADQLREFQKQLDAIIAQQLELKADTEALTDKDQATADIEAQVAALKALIDRQQSLNQRTTEAREKGLPQLDRAADQQSELRRETEQLAASMNAEQSPAKSLRQASDHQRLAEGDLSSGRASDAADAQQQALQKMREALQQLEQRRQRIARLQKSDSGKLSDDQQSLGEQTAGLSKQMAENNQSSGASGSSQTQSASQQMQQAAQQLDQQQPTTASPHQQKALEELQAAQEQLEERLRQLRDQMQEQALAALESRFRQMLERQRPLTTAVAELDGARTPAATTLDRAQKLLVTGYAAEERALADMADTTLQIIREDGTTVVFPAIVTQLRDDLMATADLLGEQRTDTYTQTLQQNIEGILEQLIDALQRAQQQQAQSGQQSAAGDQLPPLVPGSAELKLLKSAQLQVNQRTTALDQSQSDESASRTLHSESQRLADRQQQLHQMARQMSEISQ